MGSLELLSYFWSLNTIPVVKIANFDFGGLSPFMDGRDGISHPDEMDPMDEAFQDCRIGGA